MSRAVASEEEKKRREEAKKYVNGLPPFEDGSGTSADRAEPPHYADDGYGTQIPVSRGGTGKAAKAAPKKKKPTAKGAPKPKPKKA